ncbi:MAG: hypothetical protein NVS4B12_22770 [Ktedonobacteraceae bacterium]
MTELLGAGTVSVPSMIALIQRDCQMKAIFGIVSLSKGRVLGMEEREFGVGGMSRKKRAK